MQSLAPVRIGEFETQVQTLQVGPLRSTGRFELPGAALLQITSGKGKMEINQKSMAVQGGMFVTVAEGQPLKFTNEGSDLGLSILGPLS